MGEKLLQRVIMLEGTMKKLLDTIQNLENKQIKLKKENNSTQREYGVLRSMIITNDAKVDYNEVNVNQING